MKVVVDTNVLVSAIWRDRSPEKVWPYIIAKPDFTWVASKEIIDKYRRILLRPKFGLSSSLLAQWDEQIRTVISVWAVDVVVGLPRDVSDGKFLACAKVTGADFLITGDRDFATAVNFGLPTIISVRQFLQRFSPPTI